MTPTKELLERIDASWHKLRPKLIAELSSVLPLSPGDVIFTGTPEGVGTTRKPPRYIRPGDVLVSRLEGVGEMRHTFVAAPPCTPSPRKDA